MSRSQVGFLLVILLSFSAAQTRVQGARYLQEEHQVLKTDSNSGDGDFVATTKREVPSCPDPLHNRWLIQLQQGELIAVAPIPLQGNIMFADVEGMDWCCSDKAGFPLHVIQAPTLAYHKFERSGNSIS